MEPLGYGSPWGQGWLHCLNSCAEPTLRVFLSGTDRRSADIGLLLRVPLRDLDQFPLSFKGSISVPFKGSISVPFKGSISVPFQGSTSVPFTDSASVPFTDSFKGSYYKGSLKIKV